MSETKIFHILVVDDDLFNLEILSLLLAKPEYRVTTVNNGRIALENIKKELPDLILLDINMPEISGYDVCSQLLNWEETKHIPVVFISTLNSVLDKQEAFALGCSDYIVKPFVIAEVLAKVESRLQLYQLQKHSQFLENENTYLRSEVCDRFGLEHGLYRELKVATDQNQLLLHYQPIVDFKTRESLSFEALLRWKHPLHGIVSPLDFIPLAECTGLIIPIGKWVVEQAIVQLSNWNKLFPLQPNLSISVNVSGYQLLDNSLFNHTKYLLQKHNVNPKKLKLEVTESVLIKDPEATIKLLKQFKEFGIYIHIDDFGTGYSSLSRLYDFPTDTLKIDRSFVHNENWVIIESITKLASILNKDIIVEGVETERQLANLKDLGCNRGQGYYFSKPVDAKKATSMLMNSILDGIPVQTI